MGFALEPPLRRLMTPTGRLNLRVGCRMRPKPLGTFPRAFLSMRRHGAKNADYRGGVTCLYDTQLLGACLHASECGSRSRPEAVRGMPDVPIAPPATGPPEGWAAVGFVSPASFNRGVVRAFAWGFGFLTSDFGVGKSQDPGC